MILSPSGHRLDLTRQPRIDVTLSLTSNQSADQSIPERPGKADNSSLPARPHFIGSRIIFSREQAELELEKHFRRMWGDGSQEEEEDERRKISQIEFYKNLFLSLEEEKKKTDD